MLSFFAFLASLGLLAWYFRKYIPGLRKKSKTDLTGFALIWDGFHSRLIPATLNDMGLQVGAKEFYGLEVVLPMRFPGAKNTYLWVVGIEKVALANHRILEASRGTTMLGTLFKPGGDWRRILEYMVLVIPLAATIWMTINNNQLVNRVNVLQAQIADMSGKLDKLANGGK